MANSKQLEPTVTRTNFMRGPFSSVDLSREEVAKLNWIGGSPRNISLARTGPP